METLCIENYDKFKNILGRVKEKMCPRGWIMIGGKTFLRGKMCGPKDGHGWKRHSLGRRCVLGDR
jgi:hypothetical protein